MEGHIQKEIQELIQNFEMTTGTPISTQNKFNASVINVLWSIVAGHRFPHDNPQLMDLVRRTTS